MELKSISFIIFALIIAIAYFSLGHIKNCQKYIILLANIAFILLASDKKSLLLITCCVFVSYVCGILIENSLKEKRKGKAHALLLIGIILHVMILCYFKFFKDTFIIVQNLLDSKGITIGALVSPIGISYFTLTMVAYIHDIYHKKHAAERNFLDYFTFITYFPSIIQGPVNLYKKVMPQFKTEHYADSQRIYKGAMRSLWGYVKKVVIADRIGIIVISVLQNEESAGFIILWALILYSFQIYADFSGGIDVIMGFSEILDIKLTENFKSPLVSKSVTEYWQRWHMSLGEFMEKYIYYPIVLNKNVIKMSKKIKNSYFQKVFSATLASIIVFVIVGIWHGTGWNYVVYGCYQAAFVASAVLLGPVYKNVKSKLRINEKSITWVIFQTLRTFIILTIGRYFIRAKSLSQAMELFKRTFSEFSWRGVHVLFDGSMNNYGLDYKNVYFMYMCILIMICVDIVHEKGIKIRDVILQQDIVFRFFVYLAAVFAIIIFGIYGPEFNASSFIYAEF